MSKVIWNNDGTGYMVKYSGEKVVQTYLIYTPQYGINRAIDGYIHYLCRHPSSIQQVMKKISVDGPPFASTESLGFSLSIIHPPQLRPYLDRLIRDTVHEFLYDEINKNTNISDILFMARIGAIRNWSKNCPICLIENTGDEHGWGGHHCRITLFRPCGHSICTDCNKELTKCPLCRETIIKTIKNHNHVRFDNEIIDQLANIVLKSYTPTL